MRRLGGKQRYRKYRRQSAEKYGGAIKHSGIGIALLHNAAAHRTMKNSKSSANGGISVSALAKSKSVMKAAAHGVSGVSGGASEQWRSGIKNRHRLGGVMAKMAASAAAGAWRISISVAQRKKRKRKHSQRRRQLSMAAWQLASAKAKARRQTMAKWQLKAYQQRKPSAAAAAASGGSEISQRNIGGVASMASRHRKQQNKRVWRNGESGSMAWRQLASGISQRNGVMASG
jgi:hypothetical protein